MNQDPIFSGGVVKAALIILVAGALGVGAYALADGGIELPEIDLDELDQTTTNLSDTELSDTTIDAAEPEIPVPDTSDPFSSASFASTLASVRAEAGPGRELTRLFINPVQTQFVVLDGEGSGDGVEAISVRADNGEVVREDATITISGNATLEDFAFPLDGVEPAAIDRMLAAAKKQSGAGDFEPTVVSLERRIPFGDSALEWTINAEGGGRNLLYRASPDGRDVQDSGGGESPIPDVPSSLNEAQELGECIEKAGQDTEKVFACLEQSR